MLIKEKAFSFLLDCQSVLVNRQRAVNTSMEQLQRKQPFLLSVRPTLHFLLVFYSAYCISRQILKGVNSNYSKEKDIALPSLGNPEQMRISYLKNKSNARLFSLISSFSGGRWILKISAGWHFSLHSGNKTVKRLTVRQLSAMPSKTNGVPGKPCVTLHTGACHLLACFPFGYTCPASGKQSHGDF